jgi:hypothetical protein
VSTNALPSLAPALPSALSPILRQGKAVALVKLDVTFYLVEPSEAELDGLLAAYERVCPPGAMAKYLVDETMDWDSVAQPVHLGIRGRDAQAKGMKYPFTATTRERIRTGRGFALKFWDGRNVEGFSAPDSWSFSCDRIHLRESGLHAAVRATFPVDIDLDVPMRFALDVANTARFYSGHGGLSFSFNPWHKPYAFDEIYARARRYWGVDIHDLNLTLPLMRNAIKGVNWLTMLGRGFSSEPGMEASLAALGTGGGVDVQPCSHGVVLRAGPLPLPGDSNRLHPGLQPYFDVAAALKSLYLDKHPDFVGEGFIKNGNTVGWIRRFVDPGGWR